MSKCKLTSLFEDSTLWLITTKLNNLLFSKKVLTLCGMLVACNALAVDDLMFEEIPQVISSAQMYQPQNRSPASVATIDSDTIEKHGFNSIEESLILFPGLMVANVTPTQAYVSYKGESISRNFRMGLMLDNMSPILRSVSAKGTNMAPEITWHLLPVIFEDIERIEGVMSPSASVYGSDAFQAAINVLTKQPAQTQGQTAKFRHASSGLNRYFFRHGDSFGTTFFRVSVEQENLDNLNLYTTPDTTNDFTEMPALAAPLLQDPADNDFKKQKLIWQSTTDLSTSSQLAIKFGEVRLDNPLNALRQKLVGEIHQVSGETDRITVGKAYQFESTEENKNQFANLSYKQELQSGHALELLGNYDEINYQQSPIQCISASLLMASAGPIFKNYLLGQPRSEWGDILWENRFNPDILPYAATLASNKDRSLCGTTVNDLQQRQYGFGVKDVWQINDATRAVSTLNVSRNHYDSDRVYGGAIDFNDADMYTNVEYRPNNKFTINSGIQLSHVSKHENFVEPSARLGVNYHLNQHHTFRVAYSQGKWLPKLENFIDFELALQLAEQFEGSNTAKLAIANDVDHQLEAETNDNIEVGYYAFIPEFHQAWDVRIYKERQRDLIPSFANIILGFSHNTGKVEQLGTEAQFKQALNDNVSLALSAFYVDSEITDYFAEEPFSSYGGGAMLEWEITTSWGLALSYHGSHGNTSRSSLDQIGLNINKSFSFANSSKLKLSTGARHMSEIEFREATDSFTYSAANPENTLFYGAAEYSF